MSLLKLKAPDKNGKASWVNSPTLSAKYKALIIEDIESKFEAPEGCKIAVTMNRGSIGFAAVPTEGKGAGKGSDPFAE